MMMMMMNCFCGMVDRRKALSLVSSGDHRQRSSSPRISDTPRAGLEPAQNLSSGFAEWNCVVVITTTPRRRCSSPIFSKVTVLQPRFLTICNLPFLNKTTPCIFQEMFRNSASLKVSENSQKIIFSRGCFKQSGLSNLPPITILKTDSTTNVSTENFWNCRESVSGRVTFLWSNRRTLSEAVLCA